MPRQLRKSRAVVYLLLGFAVFFALYVVSWVLTTVHTNSHLQLMEHNERSAIKMHVLASLIEIARERSRLAHEMILIDDVFKKDELAQEVNALAANFIVKRKELLELPLSDTTKEVLNEQMSIYPIVIQGFDRVAELALEDTPEANELARSILINQVVPNQHRLIDGFMQIMHGIEQDVVGGSRDLRKQYDRHSQLRDTLGVATLILSLIIIFVLTRNIAATERRLIQFSTVDALTGVLNRRSFDQELELEWKRSMRSNRPLSLILIDVDHFKPYNDLYGHYEGDRCLKQVARVLAGVVYREEDIIARYGGEEFAVLLPNVGEDGAWEVAQRLRLTVYAEQIKHQCSTANEILTISLGMVALTGEKNRPATDLIKMADEALYQSKKEGRNQVSIYDPNATSIPLEQGLTMPA
jgi:diguanylate cyclase (GGDEF)-like protein